MFIGSTKFSEAELIYLTIDLNTLTHTYYTYLYFFSMNFLLYFVIYSKVCYLHAQQGSFIFPPHLLCDPCFCFY